MPVVLSREPDQHDNHTASNDGDMQKVYDQSPTGGEMRPICRGLRDRRDIIVSRQVLNISALLQGMQICTAYQPAVKTR